MRAKACQNSEGKAAPRARVRAYKSENDAVTLARGRAYWSHNSKRGSEIGGVTCQRLWLPSSLTVVFRPTGSAACNHP